MNAHAKTAIILLLKGIFYKSDNENAFFELLENSHYVIQEYFEMIGLEVHIHEEDGYAYLRNIIFEDEKEALPKLIPTKNLSYKVSLLCVLLRQKIAQFEAQVENERAIITKEEMLSMLGVFLDTKFNEVKFEKDIEATIGKIEDLGFLKQLKTGDYEIKPALKAFVDIKWLDDFDIKLKDYKEAKEWN